MKTKKLIKMFLFSFLLIASTAFADEGFANDAMKLANQTVNLVKDSSITGYIYAQIALDNTLSQQNISVTTNKGVVTLEGTVASDTEASSLIQLASSAAGVVSVNASKLKVKKSKQPISDMIITAKIKGMLVREKLFNDKEAPANVSVETSNGVVYLSGTVINVAQAQTAVKLAQSVSGVTRVESTIKVVNNGH